MTSLHAALEQERSKVKVLQAELAKYQVCFYNFDSVFITNNTFVIDTMWLNNCIILGQNLFTSNINFVKFVIQYTFKKYKVILDVGIN